MKHHPYHSPLQKCWSPKKGSPGRKLTFNSLRKATPSPNKYTNMPESPTKRQLLPPTNSSKCNSISKQVKQHARSSPQKGALSPNKFTNVQETVEELDGCHEGRYNIEVTKLKTVIYSKSLFLFFF